MFLAEFHIIKAMAAYLANGGGAISKEVTKELFSSIT
jgi:hypothetical protein